MRSCFLLLILPAMAAAQAGTAAVNPAVEGDVVNSVTGAPVAGAYVAGGDAAGTKTDAAGHFRLAAGVRSYIPLEVMHAGFLRRRRQILRRDGQPASNLRIELTPAAIITGKIVDEEGLPVETQIWAEQYSEVKGEKKLGAIATAQSDDLGQYRLTNLAAGRYWIRAGSGSAGSWDRRYVGKYYPGTLKADDNGQIEVEAGRERDGVDIRLTKYEGVTVSGRVERPAATAASRPFSPIYLEADPPNMETLFGREQRDGSFTIRHVPPGDYILRASFADGEPKAGDLLGEQKLRIGDADERDILLKPQVLQAVDLAGMVALKGGGNPSPVRIMLSLANGRGASVLPNADGSFVLKGLLPGHYEVRVMPDMKFVNGGVDVRNLYGTSYPVSAQYGEKEVLETGIDLDGPAAGPLRIALDAYIQIDGKLLSGSGEPMAGVLLAVESGEALGKCCMAFADAEGTFRLMVRHSGEYHIYLESDSGDAGAPDYFKKHEGDFPVLRVADGPNPPLTVRLPAAQAQR